MKAKIDLSALKQLSNIELFLLLCGTITVSSDVPTMLIHAGEPMLPFVE